MVVRVACGVVKDGDERASVAWAGGSRCELNPTVLFYQRNEGPSVLGEVFRKVGFEDRHTQFTMYQRPTTAVRVQGEAPSTPVSSRLTSL